MRRPALLLIASLASIGLVACGGDDDLSAPSVAIDSGPSSLTNQTHVSVAFHAVATATSGSAAGFACAVDSAAPASCTSPFAFDVTDGAHTFEVAAVGDNGSAGMPASVTWTTDSLPPDTTITDAPTGTIATATVEIAFSSPDNDVDHFECEVDTSGFSTCTSSTTLSPGDGPHTFQVRAIDHAGNVDPTPASTTFTIDTSVPTVTITGGPTGVTSSASPSFTFTTAGEVASVTCAIDSTPFATCSSPFTAGTLGQGFHQLIVRAANAAGVFGFASRSFTVDSIAPTVAITSGPSGPTNQTLPAWTFTTAGTPASVTCVLDAAASVACSSVFVPSTALAAGSHTFTVTAADAAGNTASDSRTIQVVLGGPTVTITGGPTGATSVTTPTFTFATTGSPSSTQCRIDNGAFGDCTTATSFTTTFLADGAHTFTVAVSDVAGNVNTASQAFTVDTHAPQVVITGGPSGQTNQQPVFTFFTDDAVVVQCRFDTAAFVACSNMFGATLPDGPHTFEVQGTDAAGNSSSASQSFTLDTQLPTVTITGGPTGTSGTPTPTFTFVTTGATSTTCKIDSGALAPCTSPFVTPTLGGGAHLFTVFASDASGNFTSATRSFSIDSAAPSVSILTAPTDPTNAKTPSFTFTVGANAATVQCQVDGGAFVDCSGSFTTAVLSEGSHTFIVQACNAGAVCATDDRTFTVDLTPPTLVFTTLPTTPGNLTTVTIGFTATGASTVTCVLDGGASTNCASSFTASSLSDASHTLVVTATDAAGNVTTKSTTFVVDTIPPTVSFTGGPTGATNLAPLPLFTFTTAGAPVTTQCAFNGDAFAACTTSFPTPSALADGSHEGTNVLHVKVTDAATNSATFDQAFTVDTIAPVVAISGPSVSSDANPTFTVSAPDGGGTSPVAITCRIGTGAFQSCGSTFSPGAIGDGSYVLEVQGTDPAGNVGDKTFAFQIDTQAPTLNVSAPTIITPGTDPRPTLLFAASDASTSGTPPGTLTVVCKIDGSTVPCTSSGSLQASADLQAAGTEGTHTYEVDATDSASPSPHTTPLTVTFVVDLAAPVLAITQAPSAATEDTNPSFTFTATDLTLASASCTIAVGSGSPTAVACASGTSFTLPDAPLAAGAYTLAISATDTVGHTSTLADTFVESGFVAANVGLVSVTTPTLCDNAFSAVTANPPLLGLCTRDQGVWDLPLNGAGSGTWVNSSGSGASGLQDLHGHVLYAGPDNGQQAEFVTNPAATTGLNLWRNTSFSGPAWNNNMTAAETAIGSDAVAHPVQIYTLKTEGSSNSEWAGWHETLGPVFQHGLNKTAVTNVVAAGATGTVTSLGVSCCSGVNVNGGAIPSGDLYVTVYGRNPSTIDPSADLETGSAATGGGIYFACDLATTASLTSASAGTFVARNGSGDDASDPTGATHVLDADKPFVYAITPDNSTFSLTNTRTCATTSATVTFATTWYVALRGGGQVYTTIDGGNTWTKNNAGLPVGAEVFKVVNDCATTSVCPNPNVLYAATSEGLYTATLSAGQPLHWAAAGVEGLRVRSINLISHVGAAPTIYLGVDDETRVYLRP